MRLVQKIWRNVIVLFTLLLGCYFLSHSNLAQDVKGMGKKTTKQTVSYLGSVSLEASLADLVSAEDKWKIKYKENWLSESIRHAGVNLLYVSRNGKFKAVLSVPSSHKGKGELETSFIDSTENVIWNALTGDVIFMSNNGKNIASTNIIGGKNIVFYDVRKSTDPIAIVPNYGTNIFSEDGNHFFSIGSKMALYSADGILIWEKATEIKDIRSVAISKNATSIVIAGEALLGVAEVQSKSQPGGTIQEERISPKHGSTINEKQQDVPQGEHDHEKTKIDKANQPVSNKDRKSYVSFFNGNGTLINQLSLPYPRIGHLTISGNGRYAAAVYNNTILFFDARTGSWLWKYEFPNVYWWTTSMALSEDGEVLCVAVLSNRGDPLSPQHLFFFDNESNKVGDYQLEKPSSQQPGPIVTFSEDSKFVLAATKTIKYCFRISYSR